MTVTITAYKRPELLRACLASVRKSEDRFLQEIYISVDWHSPEMSMQMAEVINDTNRQDLQIWYHPKRIGVANNARYIYNAALETKSDWICAIEEDTLVSPDFIELSMNMLVNNPGIPFVNLCSHQAPLGNNPAIVHEDNELRGGYGWAFSKKFWKQLHPYWNGKNRPPYGWDWYVTYLCYREKWKVLTPEVSRVFNTGRDGGTYDTPENYDKRVQRVCDVMPKRYEIVKHELDWRQPDWVQAESR